MSLLVIVPTRKRKPQCERFIEAFDKTADEAELLFVTDGDDDTYEEMDWQGHQHAFMDPRGSLQAKLNYTASQMMDSFDQLMFLADDTVPETLHWDTLMLTELEDMGGSGILYPNDGRRKDVPEHWLVSTDIIRELGWFANPACQHYYLDNSWAEIGKRASLLHYCPRVKINHLHYAVDKNTAHDAVYSETEQLFGAHDAQAFAAWRGSTQVAAAVSRLRRKFNPDVAWVLSKS